ncbi:MAG: VpaChn25_0724 family phage protein [Paracoccaceae bacterium]
MWDWPVARIETEKRRLEVLRYLCAQPGYQAALSIVRLHCQRIGVPSTRDQIEQAATWLDQAGLITVRDLDRDPVARITHSGREVAEGLTAVPGILRPDP